MRPKTVTRHSDRWIVPIEIFDIESYDTCRILMRSIREKFNVKET